MPNFTETVERLYGAKRVKSTWGADRSSSPVYMSGKRKREYASSETGVSMNGWTTDGSGDRAALSEPLHTSGRSRLDRSVPRWSDTYSKRALAVTADARSIVGEDGSTYFRNGVHPVASSGSIAAARNRVGTSKKQSGTEYEGGGRIPSFGGRHVAPERLAPAFLTSSAQKGIKSLNGSVSSKDSVKKGGGRGLNVPKSPMMVLSSNHRRVLAASRKGGIAGNGHVSSCSPSTSLSDDDGGGVETGEGVGVFVNGTCETPRSVDSESSGRSPQGFTRGVSGRSGGTHLSGSSTVAARGSSFAMVNTSAASLPPSNDAFVLRRGDDVRWNEGMTARTSERRKDAAVPPKHGGSEAGVKGKQGGNDGAISLRGEAELLWRTRHLAIRDAVSSEDVGASGIPSSMDYTYFAETGNDTSRVRVARDELKGLEGDEEGEEGEKGEDRREKEESGMTEERSETERSEIEERRMGLIGERAMQMMEVEPRGFDEEAGMADEGDDGEATILHPSVSISKLIHEARTMAYSATSTANLAQEMLDSYKRKGDWSRTSIEYDRGYYQRHHRNHHDQFHHQQTSLYEDHYRPISFHSKLDDYAFETTMGIKDRDSYRLALSQSANQRYLPGYSFAHSAMRLNNSTFSPSSTLYTNRGGFPGEGLYGRGSPIRSQRLVIDRKMLPQMRAGESEKLSVHASSPLIPLKKERSKSPPSHTKGDSELRSHIVNDLRQESLALSKELREAIIDRIVHKDESRKKEGSPPTTNKGGDKDGVGWTSSSPRIWKQLYDEVHDPIRERLFKAKQLEIEAEEKKWALMKSTGELGREHRRQLQQQREAAAVENARKRRAIAANGEKLRGTAADLVSRREQLDPALAELSAEAKYEVDKALGHGNGGEILAFHEGTNIEVSRTMMHCLKPNSWLNDEVINVYLGLLKERERRNPGRFPRCHFFNTFFFNKLYRNHAVYEYNSVRRWTVHKKIGYYLLDCDKIIIPVHLTIHWCLAVINLREKKLQYFDSLEGRAPDVLENLARYLQDEVRDKCGKDLDTSRWQREYLFGIPLQSNGCDCGVFMVKYADYQSRNAPLTFSQKDMDTFRRRMVWDILRLRTD